MLTLFVDPKKIVVQTVDGVRLSVYPIRIFRGPDPEFLNDCTNLSEVKDMRIFLRRWKRFWKLRIHPDTKKAVVKFLNHYHTKQDITFDCYAFANLVRGISAHSVAYANKYWSMQIKRRWSRVGDVIFLQGTADNYFRHAAVYIGWGLYISVYGAGGDLEIATLSDMQREFEADFVVVATPIRKKLTSL